jgi:hypothetical protein
LGPFLNAIPGALVTVVAYFFILGKSDYWNAVATVAGGYAVGTVAAWSVEFFQPETPNGLGWLIYGGGPLGALLAAFARRYARTSERDSTSFGAETVRTIEIGAAGGSVAYVATLLGAIVVDILGGPANGRGGMSDPVAFSIALTQAPGLNFIAGAIAATVADSFIMHQPRLRFAIATLAIGYCAGIAVAWLLVAVPVKLPLTGLWPISIGGVAGLFIAAFVRRRGAVSPDG